MRRLLEIIRRSELFLDKQGISRPRREAEEVIADCLGLKRLDLYLQFERPLTENELTLMRTAIQRRGNHEPTAYIAGRVQFAGVELKVSPAVLIPRPETELLVEKITHELQKEEELEKRVLWDLCCGSGCIGIALQRRFPQLKVILSDLSPAAIEIARENAPDMEIRQGDLFAPFAGEKCDYLVSNPPYVTQEAYQTLDPEVRDWEPKEALIGGERFYDRIAAQLNDFLKPQGRAWFEIGFDQGQCVPALFEARGFSGEVETDWSGHPRFFANVQTK